MALTTARLLMSLSLLLIVLAVLHTTAASGIHVNDDILILAHLIPQYGLASLLMDWGNIHTNLHVYLLCSNTSTAIFTISMPFPLPPNGYEWIVTMPTFILHQEEECFIAARSEYEMDTDDEVDDPSSSIWLAHKQIHFSRKTYKMNV